MLPGGKEANNPNVAGWLEKQWLNLEADILPACGTDKAPCLAPLFMRFHARSKLQSRSVRNGTNEAQKPSGDWKEGMVSTSSKDASSSGLSMESMRTE